MIAAGEPARAPPRPRGARARHRGRRPSSGRRPGRRGSRSSRCALRPAPRSRLRSAASFVRTSSPASSAPVLPMNRALAPSSAAQAATLAACPPGPDANLGVGVPAGGDRSRQADDHVEGEITERADQHCGRDRKITIVDGGESRGRFRTFLLGGLVGASAAIAAVDRRRRAQKRRGRRARPRGLRERAVLPRAPRARA